MRAGSWKLAFARFVSVVFLLMSLSLGIVGPAPPRMSAHSEIHSAVEGSTHSPVMQSMPVSPQATTATYWAVETVDGDGSVGQFTSLAIDSTDQLHVGYYDGGNTALLYAHFDGTDWMTTTVDNHGSVGQHASLDLDAGESPHISYYESESGLRHAYLSGTAWITERVDYDGDVGESSSLAIGTSDDILISYYDTFSQSLKFARYYNSTWLTTTLDPGPGVGRYTAIDAATYPHIVYYDASNDALNYTEYQGLLKGWDFSNSPVNGAGEGGLYPALVLDASNNPHVSYFDDTDGQLMYAYHDGAVWSNRVIDTVGFETVYSAIAVDGSGLPHIAYNDDLNGDLLYASYIDGTNWDIEIVDDSGGARGYPSLAFDADGYPHITYYHIAGLKHAWLRPCIAPTSLAIDGPSTVYAGSSGTFTATVGPPTTTVPLTVTWSYPTWEDDVVDVVNSTEAVRSFLFPSETGTYPLTVTVENCGGAIQSTHLLTVEPPPAPDLIVTDIWEDSGEFYYQVQNIGTALASSHYDRLDVDGGFIETQYVFEIVDPTARYSGVFSYTWTCTGITDTIRVTADSVNNLAELDETNNVREEIFLCDAEPPVFVSGPDVAATDLYTAVIEWETDKPAEGYVWYGYQPGNYVGSAQDLTLSTSHRITVTGLSPFTTYAVRVGAFDASGNEAYSDDFFFTTLAPKSDPSTGNLTAYLRDGETWVFAFNTDDLTHADRVEFYVDGELIATDYSPAYVPDDPNGDFQFSFEANGPSLAWTRNEFYFDRKLEARVYSPVKWGATIIDLNGPPLEEMPYDLEILTPYDNHVLAIETSVVLPGQTVDIDVEAIAYEWTCDWDSLREDPYTSPPNCGDVAQSMSELELTVLDSGFNAIYTDTVTPNDFGHQFLWDLSGLPPDAYHIRVDGRTPDGHTHRDENTFYIAQQEPTLSVSRNVEMRWTGGSPGIHVELTVTNEGDTSSPVTLQRIVDWAHDLQPIQMESVDYTVDTEYNIDGYLDHTSRVVIEFPTPLELAGGAQVTVEYVAIPILYESGSSDFAVGTQDVKVTYSFGGGWTTEEFDMPWDLPFYTAEGFLGASDYILVTNPDRLFGLYAGGDVDALLSTMAHLAWRKNGVLGYLETYAGSREILDELVEPGGYWAESLAPEFQNIYGGYMLLVGETEIIPAWTSLNFDICWDIEDDFWHCDGQPNDVYDHDHWYANTQGSGGPDLIVGRAIGNDAGALAQALETSLSVYEGQPGHHFDQFDGALEDFGSALLVSGRGDQVTYMRANVERIADTLDDDGWGSQQIIHWQDVPEADYASVFIAGAEERDYIHFSGHGNVDTWGPGIGTDHLPMVDFVNHHPFVFAPSCLTGNYESGDDENIAEAFFDRGAGAYIGSTQVSPVDTNIGAGESFAARWSDNEWLGHNLVQLERDMWDTYSYYDWYRFWVQEFNFYGDPKYGHHDVSTRAAAPRASQAVTTSLHVRVPDYQVTTTVDGFDLVSIPGGVNLIDAGWYDVPVYVASLDYPAGVRVQHVELITRTGYSLTVGLNIPTNTVIHTPYVATNPTTSTSPSPLEDEAWFPAPGQIYDWTTTDNPDGSTTLNIQLFPFHYNYLTTFGEFYSDFEFAIDVMTTSVSIDGMALDEAAYAPGDPITIDAWVGNSGTAEDVVVYASVLEATSEEVLSGQDLRTLYDVTGRSALSFEWDSSGVPVGNYVARVEIYDFTGTLLDSATEEFQLGVSAAEVTSLTAAPDLFHPGDTVSITLTLSNTGSVSLTGEAVIQIQVAEGMTTTATFTHTVTDLPPGNQLALSDMWDTTGATAEDYRIVGYVKYDSQTTNLAFVDVTTWRQIYLPLVLRY